MESYSDTNIGDSIYQVECKRYYNALRKIHSAVFTSDPKRVKAEKHDERYSNCNMEGIKNLYSLIEILALLLKDESKVKGIDYGCGTHYLVSDLSDTYEWDLLGFDIDEKAINEAQKLYARASEKYVVLDLLKATLPVENESQNFVFCNAVIQHFSTKEALHAFKDIYRVLKKNGIFLIIFKRKIQDWGNYTKQTGIKVNILNEDEGMIEIEDEEMRDALHKLKKGERDRIKPNYLNGMRLIHFFSIDEITDLLEQIGFKITNNIELPNGQNTNGIITYKSGKNIHTVAAFFIKS